MEMKQLLIKFNILLLFFLVGCGGDSGRATQSVLPTPVVTYTPGEIVTDNQGYVSYRVGNTPIIITVPHDGTLTPSNLLVIVPVLSSAARIPFPFSRILRAILFNSDILV